MGCLGATVLFSTTPPTTAALLAALHDYVGEPVTYDEYLGQLSCEATGDAYGFQAHLHVELHIWEEPTCWELLNTNLKGGYLWYATLVVLQNLGGTCDWAIPSWGFKSWHLAKRECNSFFARYPSYTYAEARRLGIVK